MHSTYVLPMRQRKLCKLRHCNCPTCENDSTARSLKSQDIPGSALRPVCETCTVFLMQQTSSPAVRLNPGAWRAWMGRLNIARVEEQAEHVGVSRAQLYKVI